MSHPSQVSMSELQSFMTAPFIINAFQKLGHHPISAVLTKKRKGDDKEICIIQFANEDAAKQAVFKLNGKAIPGNSYTLTKFKLSQCIGNRTPEHNVWVGDLTADVDDYHFFKFFADRYTSLCNAKVIVDPRSGASKGYGFLRFTNEEEQKHCLKNMGGSLGLGCRPIKVGPVTKAHTSANSGMEAPEATNENTESNDTPSESISFNSWQTYTSWNQPSNDQTKLTFAAVESRTTSTKDEASHQDLRLVDYNVTLNVNDLNTEVLEKDCYLWDALECTKWLPEGAFNATTAAKA